MTETKGTTGMVAYIALLVIAGASLGHREDSFGAGTDFRADAFSARAYSYESVPHAEAFAYGETVRIEFS